MNIREEIKPQKTGTR